MWILVIRKLSHLFLMDTFRTCERFKLEFTYRNISCFVSSLLFSRFVARWVKICFNWVKPRQRSQNLLVYVLYFSKGFLVHFFLFRNHMYTLINWFFGIWEPASLLGRVSLYFFWCPFKITFWLILIKGFFSGAEVSRIIAVCMFVRRRIIVFRHDNLRL